MSETATPPAHEGGTPPAAPGATPANSQPETVTLDKKVHDQLIKDAARAPEAQSRADRYEGVLKKHGLIGGGHFKPATPATPPTQEESQAAAADEDRKAERGLMSLALDPAHRAALDADPTLREILMKNPLAVLPLLAPDALDADDAVGLVREALLKRAPAPKLPETPPATPPATPPLGAVNPQDKPVNAEVEAAKQLPNTERAVAGMIGARLRSMKK